MWRDDSLNGEHYGTITGDLWESFEKSTQKRRVQSSQLFGRKERETNAEIVSVVPYSGDGKCRSG